MELKVKLNNDSLDEFKEKIGDALDILNHGTESSYQEITTEGFIDWACDLWWIPDEEIEIEITGSISALGIELLNEICDFWKNDAETVIADGKKKIITFTIKNNKEKLNIENTETIDSLAFEDNTNKLILCIWDGMDWRDEGKHILLLQSKLNNYIRYIDTKQYSEKYPNTNNIEIKIGFLFKEPQICNDFIEKVVKPKIAELFNNVDIIVEHGTKE